MSSDSGDSIHLFAHRLSRSTKRSILMLSDYFLFIISLWLAYTLRIGPPSQDLLESLAAPFLITGIGGVLICWMLGFYNTLIRAFEFRTINVLAGGVVVTGLLIYSFAFIFPELEVPRSVPAIFMLVAFPLIASSRIVLRWYYKYSLGLNTDKKTVLIYGAGIAGGQVAGILTASPDFSLVGFVDDDKSLQGQTLRGRRIYSPEELDKVVQRFPNVRVLLSILNLTSQQKRAIFSKLERYNVQIEIIPAINEVLSGRESIANLREVSIEDLLGREPIPPIQRYFEDAIRDKVVFVSGAGGSIGSEICRQVLANNPKMLIAFDQSEFNLYAIEQELRARPEGMAKPDSMAFHLGNVLDGERLSQLFSAYQPDVVYHAAAYKHVPIVEENPLQGVKNNIFGTREIAEQSLKAGVSRFILVSTDKAVRPTNVMGATKRVAELVVHALAKSTNKTVFSMVRFGNVLGSSGSVIPLFKKQIEMGGPVTVTHKDVTRYFMTIPEAAQLVIQAGFFAKGGDVFVLDMGEPIKIIDLARYIIRLSGFSPADEENPSGDIEIKVTGLRPGEKLYEEILIDGNATGSPHPKIMMANEKFLDARTMARHLKVLEKAIHQNDPRLAAKEMESMVDGFKAGV